MIINYNGKDVELVYSFRSMIMFENLNGETFTGHKGITETLTFFYCTLVNSTKDYSISFEDVIDWLDQNKTVLT